LEFLYRSSKIPSPGIRRPLLSSPASMLAEITCAMTAATATRRRRTRRRRRLRGTCVAHRDSWVLAQHVSGSRGHCYRNNHDLVF
jgi:hypothetical protein